VSPKSLSCVLLHSITMRENDSVPAAVDCRGICAETQTNADEPWESSAKN